MKREERTLLRVKRQMLTVLLLAMCLSLLLYLCREDAAHDLQELIHRICDDVLPGPMNT